MLEWILTYWSILVPLALLLAGCAAVHVYLGAKPAAAIFAAGFAFIIFIFGRKIERDSYKKIADDIEDKREQAYEKIDSRGTDQSDVVKRLRQGNY